MNRPGDWLTKTKKNTIDDLRGAGKRNPCGSGGMTLKGGKRRKDRT